MIPKSKFNLGDAVTVRPLGEQPFEAVISGVSFNRRHNRIEYSVVESDRFESDAYLEKEIFGKLVA